MKIPCKKRRDRSLRETRVLDPLFGAISLVDGFRGEDAGDDQRQSAIINQKRAIYRNRPSPRSTCQASISL